MASDIEKNLKKVRTDGEPLVSISTDGSNHDGHQHWSIIHCVDVYLFRNLIKRGWIQRTLKNYSYNIDCVRSVIEIPLYEKISKLKIRFDKHKRATFKIKGTTYSGSCSRTTLGNTLRVFLYWYYICYKCGFSVLLWNDSD